MRCIKGQSAIEYLTTYGWMLMVIAIVGGVLFSVVDGYQTTNVDISGLDSGQVSLTQEGFNSFDEVNFVLRNTASDDVEIQYVNLTDGQSSVEVSYDESISVSDEESFILPHLEEASQNEYELEVVYDTGGLEDLVAEGTVNGQFSINKNFSNSPTGAVASDLSDVNNDIVGEGTPEDPYQIYNSNELQSMSENLTAHYVLRMDIDASGTETWNSGEGFYPVGDNQGPGTCGVDRFCGSLDGNGKEIENLHINRSNNYQGLFGFIDGTGVAAKDLKIENPDVSGGSYTGVMAGYQTTTAQNISVRNGLIDGGNTVGGVIGRLEGDLTNSSVINTEVQSSSWHTGGLVGFMGHAYVADSKVVDSKVNAGGARIGGLVGRNWAAGSTITDSYVESIEVNGGTWVGGIVGSNERYLFNSYAEDVDVQGGSEVGGAAGRNNVAIENVYVKKGNVSGTDNVGGITGYNHDGANIVHAYSALDDISASDLATTGNMAGAFENQSDSLRGYWNQDLISGLDGVGNSDDASYNISGRPTEDMKGSDVTQGQKMGDYLLFEADGGQWRTRENSYPVLKWQK